MPLARRLLIMIFLLGVPALVFAGEPIRAYDLKFSPPLLGMSRPGTSKEILAVQAAEDVKGPGRVIAIDERGRVRLVEELADTTKVTVPGSRLWISGERPNGEGTGVTGGRELPVTGYRVFLSAGGSRYAVAYLSKGAYYEIRCKDAEGGLKFIAPPRDALGLGTAVLSEDGSTLLVVDESQPSDKARKPGQRFYIYDRNGPMLVDQDLGSNPESWLDFDGGMMAPDGGWFLATAGMGAERAHSVVMLTDKGEVAWERRFFKAHMLIQDLRGLFRLTGGSRSFIYYLTQDGELKTLERAGYGFELRVSDDKRYAYILKFKDFDEKTAGIAKRIKEIFPETKAVSLNVDKLTPAGCGGPSIEVSPDGRYYIHACAEFVGGLERTVLALYDADGNELWKDRYFGSAVPVFTGDGCGFILRFGFPVTRVISYKDQTR